MLCYRILIFGEWPAGLRGGNVYCRHQYWTLGICNISERMHLFSSMLDSETISLGSQSTANLTFHSGLYTTGIHGPFLRLVLKKSPERVLGLKYFVVYLSCTKCPPFADIRPLRNPPIQWWFFSEWVRDGGTLCSVLRWSATTGGPGWWWWLLLCPFSFLKGHITTVWGDIVKIHDGTHQHGNRCLTHNNFFTSLIRQLWNIYNTICSGRHDALCFTTPMTYTPYLTLKSKTTSNLTSTTHAFSSAWVTYTSSIMASKPP